MVRATNADARLFQQGSGPNFPNQKRSRNQGLTLARRSRAELHLSDSEHSRARTDKFSGPAIGKWRDSEIGPCPTSLPNS